MARETTTKDWRPWPGCSCGECEHRRRFLPDRPPTPPEPTP